jgi:hypothetical protein
MNKQDGKTSWMRLEAKHNVVGFILFYYPLLVVGDFGLIRMTWPKSAVKSVE